jgi:hypothetical protein
MKKAPHTQKQLNKLEGIEYLKAVKEMMDFYENKFKTTFDRTALTEAMDQLV